MDKLREEFEADFENETGWPAGDYPSQEVVSLCWLLYRQSRASIVVELPAIIEQIIPGEYHEGKALGYESAIESCKEVIRSIGLSIKGEY